MVWIDTVCLICIIVFALIGIWRGFFKSVVRLFAWIGGILGAFLSQQLLGHFITNNLEMSGFTVTLICICIGFLVPFLVISFIGHSINKKLSDSSISGLNRALGAGLGVIKALILCILFLTVLHLLPVTGNLRDTRNNSFSYTAYRWSIGLVGFSSEETDIASIAEEKMEKITQDIKEKAIEKVKKENSIEQAYPDSSK